MPTPLKPPPGWDDAHEVCVNLFLMKGIGFKEFSFADVMNNTYNAANELVFPRVINQYKTMPTTKFRTTKDKVTCIWILIISSKLLEGPLACLKIVLLESTIFSDQTITPERFNQST